MSDDYICGVCSHRAGEHAVLNKCLIDGCNCEDDPYLEQLDTLREQLDLAIHEMTRIRHGGCDNDAQICLDALSRIAALEHKS